MLRCCWCAAPRSRPGPTRSWCCIKLGVLADVHRHRHHRLQEQQPSAVRTRTASPASGRRCRPIFFTFLGLDAVSTAGEEVKDPGRTIPRGDRRRAGHRDRRSTCLVALGRRSVRRRPACSTGRRPDWPRSSRTSRGPTARRSSSSAGAVISIFSVTLVTIYGQTRILFAMGRDGMLPKVFKEVDQRTLSPIKNDVRSPAPSSGSSPRCCRSTSSGTWSASAPWPRSSWSPRR